MQKSFNNLPVRNQITHKSGAPVERTPQLWLKIEVVSNLLWIQSQTDICADCDQHHASYGGYCHYIKHNHNSIIFLILTRMRASVLFSVGKIKPYSRTAPQFPPFFLQLVATPPLFRDKSPNALQKCRKTKEEEALKQSAGCLNSCEATLNPLSRHSHRHPPLCLCVSVYIVFLFLKESKMNLVMKW